jgi:hypothetical protein
LPGIIEDPGSFAGNINSPKPERGPDPKKRKSFDIFKREVERVLRLPDRFTMGSWDAMDSNLFGAGEYLLLVNFDKYLQKILSKFLGEFIPVPTAVPPWAK